MTDKDKVFSQVIQESPTNKTSSNIEYEKAISRENNYNTNQLQFEPMNMQIEVD
jgi:hypothetical protein